MLKQNQNENVVRFRLPFAAIGKESVRGAGRRFYTPTKTRNFMKNVSLHAAKSLGNRVIKSPVSLLIWAVFERPKYLCKVYKRTNKPKYATQYLMHTSKPDADNIIKAIKDSLKNWIPDDSVVYLDLCEKNWGRLLPTIGGFIPEKSFIDVCILIDEPDEPFNRKTWRIARDAPPMHFAHGKCISINKVSHDHINAPTDYMITTPLDDLVPDGRPVDVIDS